MNNWKASLDKYLTSGPHDDGFDGWVEQVFAKLSDPFWEANEDWLMDSAYDAECNKWLCNQFHKENGSPEETAAALEAYHGSRQASLGYQSVTY